MAEDVFASTEKNPSVSWKGVPIGTKVTGVVTDPPSLVQGQDFDTSEPQYWDSDKRGKKTTSAVAASGKENNPCMVAVVNIEVDGEKRSLWAPKPGSMFRALGDAQKKAGREIEPGGTLTVTFTAEKPNPENPRLNPQKLYEAVYTPPKNGTFAQDDSAPPF